MNAASSTITRERRPAPTNLSPCPEWSITEILNVRRLPSTRTNVASALTLPPTGTATRWSNWTRLATLVRPLPRWPFRAAQLASSHIAINRGVERTSTSPVPIALAVSGLSTTSSERAKRPTARPAGGLFKGLSGETPSTTITIPRVTEPALIEEDVLERVLAVASSRGAKIAEVFAEDRSSSGAFLDDRRVEELSSGRDRGAGIRVVVGTTTGFAHTADLSERGLVAAAEAASAVARNGPGAGASPPVSLTRTTADLNGRLADRRLADGLFPSKDARLELLFRADEAGRRAGGAIVQVQVGYGDSRRRILVANTDGLYVEDSQVRTRFNVSCVAVGDSGLQTGYESVARTEGFDGLMREAGSDGIEGVALSAAKRAIGKLDARPAPSGEVPVVLAGGSGGILFHEACGHGLEADHIVKDASVYTGKIGELVASPLVTLVDDGRVSGEWGNFTFDDEGNAAKRNVLIENGVLTSYMWDWLRASEEGQSSSGNGRRESYRHLPMVRMTNTFLLAGSEDPDEVVAQTQKGVFVAKLGGGQVNTATGDFVFGTNEAYLIENGRITAPLRDANLIGNGPEILKRIDVVASDFAMTPGTCGKDGQSVPVGCGQPTLRITGVTIGGTAS